MANRRNNIEYKHYSSSSCKIYINEVLASEIAAITVGMSAPIMPIYGWRSSYLDTYCRGAVIVEGSIIVNCKYPSYLYNLINKTGVGSPDHAENRDKAIVALKQKIEEVLRQTKETVQNGGSLIGKDIIALAELNEKYNSGGDAYAEGVKLKATTPINTLLFNIRIVNPNNTVDLIDQCALTGQQGTISAGESQNVKIAYSFIAKNSITA